MQDLPYNKKRPKLSSRMQLFIELAIRGEAFWDICCDHGHVGIGAMDSGLFKEVHFVDQLPHIMQRLAQQIERYAPEENQKFYLHAVKGEDISNPVKGTCLIAGVGGLTTRRILSTLVEKNILDAKRLLLSPHSDDAEIGDFAHSKKFAELYLLSEKIPIKVGKKMKTLYVFDRTDKKSLA